LPTTCNTAEIEIFDIVGNKIEIYPLNTKGIMTTLQLNSVNYSGGFFFCILTVDGNKEGWKKLVIIK
jgi:hypothetical protein